MTAALVFPLGAVVVCAVAAWLYRRRRPGSARMSETEARLTLEQWLWTAPLYRCDYCHANVYGPRDPRWYLPDDMLRQMGIGPVTDCSAAICLFNEHDRLRPLRPEEDPRRSDLRVMDGGKR